MGARPVACTVCEHHAESTFAVEGMDCREEVVLLERRFKNLPGLEDFTADVMGRRLLVKYDAAKLSASAIAAAAPDADRRVGRRVRRRTGARMDRSWDRARPRRLCAEHCHRRVAHRAPCVER